MQKREHMKKAYIFPGQGSQFPGMAQELYNSCESAKAMFERANEILGFRITDIMFSGNAEELKQTKVTQPAVFLHSAILAKHLPDFCPDMVAGHSLGEFSALAAAGALDFEDALRLVSIRAQAMQKACEMQQSTMAAIIGLDDEKVEEICNEISNFNLSLGIMGRMVDGIIGHSNHSSVVSRFKKNRTLVVFFRIWKCCCWKPIMIYECFRLENILII